MELAHSQQLISISETDLEERICLIIDLWGGGEPIDEERISEVARNLYNIDSMTVRKVLINILLGNKVKAKFYLQE